MPIHTRHIARLAIRHPMLTAPLGAVRGRAPSRWTPFFEFDASGGVSMTARSPNIGRGTSIGLPGLKRRTTVISRATRMKSWSMSGRRPTPRAAIGKPTAWPLEAARHAAAKARAAAISCAALIRTWHARQAERVFLEGLHDFQLQQMGLSRDDRRREANKPFWRD
jgi:uncharacterized protein YjiS (DUF1127 family)